jgi:hypothetical protein
VPVCCGCCPGYPPNVVHAQCWRATSTDRLGHRREWRIFSLHRDSRLSCGRIERRRFAIRADVDDVRSARGPSPGFNPAPSPGRGTLPPRRGLVIMSNYAPAFRSGTVSDLIVNSATGGLTLLLRGLCLRAMCGLAVACLAAAAPAQEPALPYQREAPFAKDNDAEIN